MPLSYHWPMVRTDIYLKVQLDHGSEENVQKLAAEISRQLLKIYSVRNVEVQNIITDKE